MDTPQYSVVVERTVGAPAQRVYDAWLTPADWDRWFTNNSQIDARVGGRYVNGDHDTGTASPGTTRPRAPAARYSSSCCQSTRPSRTYA
jgi:uncharacterized protein YndB with AHSA1/START domain